MTKEFQRLPPPIRRAATSVLLHEIHVSSAMARDVCSCRTTDPVGVALRILRTNQLHRLPVVDAGDRLVGMLSLADLAREAARQRGRTTAAMTAQDIADTVEAVSQPRSPRDVLAA